MEIERDPEFSSGYGRMCYATSTGQLIRQRCLRLTASPKHDGPSGCGYSFSEELLQERRAQASLMSIPLSVEQ